MPYIFELWLKNPPDYAVVFCRLLLVRFLIEQLFITLGNAISAVGSIRQFQLANSILNFFPLVLTLALFWSGFLPWTMYLAFMAYSILQAGLLLYYAKTQCGLAPATYLREVAFRGTGALAASFSAGLAPLLVLPPGPLRLGAVVLASTTGFAVSAWYIAFNKEERARLQLTAQALSYRLDSLRT